MNAMKPPVPVEVNDMLNFSRLVLGLTECTQVLWSFKHKDRHVLGVFMTYMYWKGELPVFAYTYVEPVSKPFIAYRSDSARGEEWLFTDNTDDTRYRYGAFTEVKNLPREFIDCLDGQFPPPPASMPIEVESINSLVRLLIPILVREGKILPLWHFTRDGKHIVGTCLPFDPYYEADALPIIFYVSQEKPPPSAFIRYTASKPAGEKIEYTRNTSNPSGFYVKIIDAKNFPLFL